MSSDDYPELDEAFLNNLVSNYESSKSLDDLGVPLPPDEAMHDLVIPDDVNDLPIFPDEIKDDEEFPVDSFEKIAPKPLIQQKTLPIQTEDVEDLDLLENVFDKRVTDDDVQREMYLESNKNDSGRLLDKKDVEVKTELNDVEIVTISKLRFMAERYRVPVLNEFTNNLMTLKISRARKGRTEFIQGLHADERREQPSESWFSRVFGGNRQ